MKKENQNIKEKNCEQKNESRKLENCVNIDWLSLNFKNVQAQDVLEVFCEATKDENLTVSNFIYNDERGFVTGYTHSYSYMGTPYIVVSFCPTRPEMGVNLQITGQGCKLIYFQDIKNFLSKISFYTNDYKCNRLDIAYDDFNRIIPVQQMIERTEQELDMNNGISTIISRIKRDMISIYTNHWNGITSKNLLYGKHRSARSFRLYDKKLEQKIEDIDYWYRLEIELRTKGKSTNADDAFKEFIAGKSIFHIFYDNISTIVSFIEDSVIFSKGFKNTDNFVISLFWLEFLNHLNESLRIICIMRSEKYEY